MKMFRKLKDALLTKRAKSRVAEESLYETIADELNRGDKRMGLWTKALRKAKGDEEKAKGLYIQFRLESIKDEKNKYVEPRDRQSLLNRALRSVTPKIEKVSQGLERPDISVEDKRLFLLATEEMDKGEPETALWATVMTFCEGNEEKARYEYIKLRVEELATKTSSEELKDLLERQAMNAFDKEYSDTFPLIINELEGLGYKIVEGSNTPLKGPWKIVEPNGLDTIQSTRERFVRYVQGRLADAKSKGRITVIDESVEHILERARKTDGTIGKGDIVEKESVSLVGRFFKLVFLFIVLWIITKIFF